MALPLSGAASKFGRGVPFARSSYDRHRTGAALRRQAGRLLGRRSTRDWPQPSAWHARVVPSTLLLRDSRLVGLRRENAPRVSSKSLPRILGIRYAPAHTLVRWSAPLFRRLPDFRRARSPATPRNDSRR